jgi:predicted transcriptional regulator of viral defense system
MEALAESQRGFFTTGQARRFGFDSTMLRYRCREGDVEYVRYGIWRMGGQPVRPGDRCHVLYLAAGGEAGTLAISHASALWLHRMVDDEPEKLHVTYTTQARSHDRDGVIRHRSTRLPEAHITRRRGMRVTSGAWAILDEFESGLTERAAMALERALSRGWISERAIRGLAAGRPLRVRSRITAVLGVGGDEIEGDQSKRRTLPYYAQIAAANRPVQRGGHAVRRRWTAEEDALIITCPARTDFELAAWLGRSLYAVGDRRNFIRRGEQRPVEASAERESIRRLLISASQTAGFVSTEAIELIGLSDVAASGLRHAGKLRRVRDGLYRLGGYVRGPLDHIHAVMALAPGGAVVRSVSALEVHDLLPVASGRPVRLSLVQGSGTGPTRVSGAVFQECDGVEPEDVRLMSGIRVVSRERAVLDLLTDRGANAEVWVTAALAKGSVSAFELLKIARHVDASATRRVMATVEASKSVAILVSRPAPAGRTARASKRRRHPWTPEEDELVLSSPRSRVRIAADLGRSEAAVASRRYALRHGRDIGRRTQQGGPSTPVDHAKPE